MKLCYPALLLTVLGSGPMRAAKATRPNIVILLADDLGWADVGYHNRRSQTPNIDRLKSDEADNTIVWFFGDNGGISAVSHNNVPLRGNKLDDFAGGVRVPACVRWPVGGKGSGPSARR